MSGIKAQQGKKAKAALGPVTKANMPVDLKSALAQGHSRLKSIENSSSNRFMRNEKVEQKGSDIRSVLEQGLGRLNLPEHEHTDHGFDQTFTFS